MFSFTYQRHAAECSDPTGLLQSELEVLVEFPLAVVIGNINKEKLISILSGQLPIYTLQLWPCRYNYIFVLGITGLVRAPNSYCLLKVLLQNWRAHFFIYYTHSIKVTWQLAELFCFRNIYLILSSFFTDRIGQIIGRTIIWDILHLCS